MILLLVVLCWWLSVCHDVGDGGGMMMAAVGMMYGSCDNGDGSSL